MSLRTATAIGLVLSHKKVGETDSLVTILTEARGKLVCRANGIRTLKSTKRSALQPGNVVSFQFTLTGKLPLLTQAILQEDCAQMDSTLPRMRQLATAWTLPKIICGNRARRSVFYPNLALTLTNRPQSSPHQKYKQPSAQLLPTGLPRSYWLEIWLN